MDHRELGRSSAPIRTAQRTRDMSCGHCSDRDISALSAIIPAARAGWLVQPWGQGNKATTEGGPWGFVKLSKCYKWFYCHLLGKCLALGSDGILLSWRYLSAGINQDLLCLLKNWSLVLEHKAHKGSQGSSCVSLEPAAKGSAGEGQHAGAVPVSGRPQQ